MRRVRISSISVPSYSSPGLSGASSGWSYKMIGADSMTSRPPSGSARTGQPPMFSHSATAAFAQMGGSVIERNSPPEMLMITWAATSAEGRASSRCSGAAPGAVRFSTRTCRRTAPHGPGSRVERTQTAPASGSRRRTVYSCAAVLIGPRFTVLAARDGELAGQALAEQLVGADADLDLAFYRLVPGRARRVGPPLHLQEPDDDLQARLAGVLEDALGLRDRRSPRGQPSCTRAA